MLRTRIIYQVPWQLGAVLLECSGLGPPQVDHGLLAERRPLHLQPQQAPQTHHRHLCYFYVPLVNRYHHLGRRQPWWQKPQGRSDRVSHDPHVKRPQQIHKSCHQADPSALNLHAGLRQLRNLVQRLAQAVQQLSQPQGPAVSQVLYGWTLWLSAAFFGEE